MTAEEEREQYIRDGYVLLSELFPIVLLNGLYEQMRVDLDLQRRQASFTAQGPLLSKPALEVYAMQYPPLMTFLWGLTPRVAATVGKRLLPTYAYFRMYQQGDVCRIHSDRPACEHSLSLTVAYGGPTPWPLSVGAEEVEAGGQVSPDFQGAPYGSVAMQAGDGVLYQGTHRRHGRLTPNPNPWSAHLFLHWVEANGRYKEHAFDRVAIEQAKAKQRSPARLSVSFPR